MIQVLVTQPIDFGGGPLSPTAGGNVALAKLDRNGAYLWSKIFPNTGDAMPRELLDDGLGNVYLVGMMDPLQGNQDFGGPPLPDAQDVNIYAVKLDGAGGYLWGHLYSDYHFQNAVESVVDSGHNLVLAGVNRGSTVDFGTGPVTQQGALVVKINQDGNTIWAKGFNGGASLGVATGSQDAVTVVGESNDAVDFGGAVLMPKWSNFMGWVVKLDASGNYIWAQGFTTTAQTPAGVVVSQVATDSQGNTILAGGFDGQVDFGGGLLTSMAPHASLFIAKYDSVGNHMWSRAFGPGDGGLSPLHALATEPNGDFWLWGEYYGSIDLGGGLLGPDPFYQGFLAHFGGSGAHLWSQAVVAGAVTPVGMHRDPSGNLAVAGQFSGLLTFGGVFGAGQYPGASEDVFVAKFKP